MNGELDDATLAALHGELDRHRDHLRAEIESQGAEPDSDDLTFVEDAGFADRSHRTEERSRAISLVRALRSNLRDVDRALDRIEDGTYGRCERCGRAISLERLEALPWAVLCIDHAQRASER
ncbi:MAG TPA: TraR/DksA C4-type zinc finger protein [Actinomycetota bacterium]|jgi:DnaK suppressor protein|nr:TraR/DksA C4-type zinc finger protein [Actinomycetota bacterium]